MVTYKKLITIFAAMHRIRDYVKVNNLPVNAMNVDEFAASKGIFCDIRNCTTFAGMVKIEAFKRKQPGMSNDYEQAYNIIKVISKGETITANADNIKAFRKYICDLAMKHDKQIATRLQHDKSINVTRLM